MIHHHYKRTRALYISVFFSLLMLACGKEKSKPDDSNNNSGDDAAATTITFGNRENYDIGGSALVAYTDGTTTTINFSKGVLKLPLSETGDKIIKSITPDNSDMILMGRKEGGSIKLNYDGTELHLRTDIYVGPTPIGSYSEFQLINSDQKTKTGKYTLEADLDLMNENWEPVICGEFDGMGHELKNLKVNISSGDAVGLFRNASKIRSLTLRSGSITSTGKATSVRYVAGICSFAGSITDCYNYANILVSNITFTAAESTAPRSLVIGGVSGTADYISNCHNYGDITVNGSGQNIDLQNIGGISGMFRPLDELSMVVSNSSNHGKITVGFTSSNGSSGAGGYSSAGGIIGNASNYISANGSYDSNSIISDCLNEGAISVDGGFYYVGGIAGIGVVNKSTNNADIKTKIGYAGGIACRMLVALNGMAQPNGNKNSGAVVGRTAGGIAANSDADLENCTNSGAITITGAIGGGIAGTCDGDIRNCINSGAVASTNPASETGDIGGIVGLIAPDDPRTSMYSETASISKCKNSGNVTGAHSTGGICGEVLLGKVIIDNSSNSGKVTGTSSVGGIAGGGILSPQQIAVESSYNTGAVKGTSFVGGIAGGSNETNVATSVQSSYNTGSVTATGDYSGGVIGRGQASTSYNTATVTGTAKLGGVCGEGYADQCYNTGNVTGNGNFIGGITGYALNNNTANSYNFWKDNTTDNAKYAFGNLPNNSAHQFSASDWPASTMKWLVGKDSTHPWKSLGSWNKDNPAYPQLYFQ